MSYPFFLCFLDENRYHPTDPLYERVPDSSYQDLGSCRIDVLDLILFIDKDLALVLVRS
jgi:hypothetical protein